MTHDQRQGDRRKAPAFQWYPGDWRRDTAIQSCTLGARGLWLEMLNLMSDGSPRGYLRAGVRAIDVSLLAKMVGAGFDEVVLLVKELEAAGVFSREKDGTIFSRRMVRDESVRLARANGGSKSLENPNVPRPRISLEDTLEDPPEDGTAVPSPAVAFASAPAKSKTKPKGVFDDWVPPFAAAWVARFQGTAPWGRIGNALKPLREQHPDNVILERWKFFLAQAKPGVSTAEGFAQTFGDWKPVTVVSNTRISKDTAIRKALDVLHTLDDKRIPRDGFASLVDFQRWLTAEQERQAAA